MILHSSMRRIHRLVDYRKLCWLPRVGSGVNGLMSDEVVSHFLTVVTVGDSCVSGGATVQNHEPGQV